MDILLWPLTAMGFVFILFPAAAAGPAAFFLWLYFKSKRIAVLLAGLAWLAYLPYEYAMNLRILCTGECNIRIDLLIIYPALLAFSLAGLIGYFRFRRRAKKA
ncbi:MAG: hypothetical protein ACU833_10950 [Gammaproteobacteria bacterium]